MSIAMGKAADVRPGGLAVFEVQGTRIAVANVNGAFYGFDDECPHASCSLAEGDLEGETVTCFCHGSKFDVRSGEVLGGPATEPVKTYPVLVEGEELQIEI